MTIDRDLCGLVLASTLQRLPAKRRIGLAQAPSVPPGGRFGPQLARTHLDGPHSSCRARRSRGGAGFLGPDCRQPIVIRFIARRLGEDIDSRPGPLNALLAAVAARPAGNSPTAVRGLVNALAGIRKARKPGAWDSFQASLDTAADPELAAQVRELNVLFGDGRALAEVKRLALDEHADLETRKTAVRTLIENRPDDLRSICERLIRVRYVNAVAVRGLALFDDAEIGKVLARNYRAFHPSDRPAALEVLVSRPSFAAALLNEVAAGRITRSDLSAFHARQIQSLGEAALISGFPRSGESARVGICPPDPHQRAQAKPRSCDSGQG